MVLKLIPGKGAPAHPFRICLDIVHAVHVDLTHEVLHDPAQLSDAGVDVPRVSKAG